MAKKQIKNIYYSNGENQFGPFDLKELESKKITVDTLIWFDGMEDWVRADQVKDVKYIIEKSDKIDGGFNIEKVKKERLHEPKESINPTPGIKKPKKSYIGFIIYFFILFSLFIGFFSINYFDKNYKKVVAIIENQKVEEEQFKNKSIISDNNVIPSDLKGQWSNEGDVEDSFRLNVEIDQISDKIEGVVSYYDWLYDRGNLKSFSGICTFKGKVTGNSASINIYNSKGILINTVELVKEKEYLKFLLIEGDNTFFPSDSKLLWPQKEIDFSPHEISEEYFEDNKNDSNLEMETKIQTTPNKKSSISISDEKTNKTYPFLGFLREGPDVMSKSIYSVRENSTIELLSESSNENFINVRVNGYEGFINKSLLDSQKNKIIDKINLTRSDSEKLDSEDKTQEKKSVLDKINNDDRNEIDDNIVIPFILVEESPVFPGCESEIYKGVSYVRDCFTEKIQNHIRINFNYPEIAKEKRIQGKVNVMFTIRKNGSIGNIRMRGPDRNLEIAAKEIIEKLPEMIPGKQKGKNVDTPYSISISYKLSAY
jgi:TonB family protein